MTINPAAAAAREAARETSGQFGEQPHSAPEVTLAPTAAIDWNTTKALTSLRALESRKAITHVHFIGDGQTTTAFTIATDQSVAVSMELNLPFRGEARVIASGLQKRSRKDSTVALTQGGVLVDGRMLHNLSPDDPAYRQRLHTLIERIQPGSYDRVAVRQRDLAKVAKIVLPATGRTTDNWEVTASASAHSAALVLTTPDDPGVIVRITGRTAASPVPPPPGPVRFSLSRALERERENGVVICEDGVALDA